MKDQGKKFDTEKIRTDLLPPDSLLSIAEILTFGANKYGDRNWEKGMDWSRVYGALLRHLFAWWMNKGPDKETGKSHLSHAGCCIMFLLAYEKRGVGKDNRPSKNKDIKTVYIASPYTKPEGKQEENTLESFRIASELIDLGFTPYAPLWSHYLDIHHPKDYKTWLDLDFEWLEKCDCVLRLPGESSGADQEVKLAEKLGIPVFYDVEELKCHTTNTNVTDAEK